MLKKCDLASITDDRKFREKIAPLQQRIGEIQRRCGTNRSRQSS